VPHSSEAKYVGMAHSPVELMVASPVPVQERLRGQLWGISSFGHHPYADSRVRLTGGRRMHSSGGGDVLSCRAPTASRMAL
jgi:hypothetical protein